MAWSTPKTDWTSADAIGVGDFNRIESNIDFTADNPSGTLLRLGPSSSAVLVNTDSDDLSGAKLQVNGDVSIKDTVPRLFFDGTTADEQFQLAVGSTGVFQLIHTSGSNTVALAVDPTTSATLINSTSDNGSGTKLQVAGSTSIIGWGGDPTSDDGFIIGGTGNSGYIRPIIAGVTTTTNDLRALSGNIWSFENTVLVSTTSDDGSGAELQVNGQISKSKGLIPTDIYTSTADVDQSDIYTFLTSYVPTVGAKCVLAGSNKLLNANYNTEFAYAERTALTTITVYGSSISGGISAEASSGNTNNFCGSANSSIVMVVV